MRATGSCRTCGTRIVEDGISPTGWRHTETGLVNCDPPRTRSRKPRHSEPMAVPATPVGYLEQLRADQQDGRIFPSDVAFTSWLAEVQRDAATVDLATRMRPAEIALMRGMRRAS